MKIVALLGSPRAHKNSATIAQRFTATAAQLGAQVRTYELNRLNYPPARGAMPASRPSTIACCRTT